MEKQRGVAEENQALRAELERLKREVAGRRVETVASGVSDPLVRRGDAAGRAGMIRDSSKAIQQDFPDMTVSKGGVCLEGVCMTQYLRVI